jgi:acyl carrier protein
MSQDNTVIREIVTKHLQRKQSIEDDTLLVSGGLIDSMSIVDLILELQNAFGVIIPASEVEPDDFDSISAIARTVARFR